MVTQGAPYADLACGSGALVAHPKSQPGVILSGVTARSSSDRNSGGHEVETRCPARAVFARVGVVDDPSAAFISNAVIPSRPQADEGSASAFLLC
jgi:hypothetical protein